MSVCDRNCFCCPYPDCVDDTMTPDDVETSRQIEKDFIRPQKKARDPEKQKAYREANREKLSAYHRQYLKTHKEQRKAYYAAHREEKIIWQRAYYAAHKEELARKRIPQSKEDRRAYYAANRDRILARQKANYAARKKGKNDVRKSNREDQG